MRLRPAYPLKYPILTAAGFSHLATPMKRPRIDRSEIPPFVLFALERLKSSGHEAHIVGGAIRDVCLGRPPTDWDVATSASPAEIQRIFQDRRHFALKHQTVTLVDAGRHYEVTPFRGSPPGLLADLRHRDFTMNAIALDFSRGEVIDPEKGCGDIRARLVRATGDPVDRFLEDPVRLLRAVRFAAQFDFRIEAETHAAITLLAGKLGSASPERIRDELVKTLVSGRPSGAFRILVRTGLLLQFLPELLEGYLKRQGDPPSYTIFRHLVETVDRVDPLPVLRLAALFHDAAKPRVRRRVQGRYVFPGHDAAGASLSAEALGRLRFSREDIRSVAHLVRHHAIPWSERWDDGAARRLLVTVGRNSILFLLLLRRADLLASGPYPLDLSSFDALEGRIRRVMNEGVPESIADLAVGGDTVMQVLGLQSGPRVGEVLSALWEKVIDHPEWNEKKRLTQLLKQILTDSPTRGPASSS